MLLTGRRAFIKFSTHFKITSAYVKYLGIRMFQNPSALFKLKLREDIEISKTLPMSLIGRVNTVKVVPLPRVYIYIYFIFISACPCMFSFLNIFLKLLDFTIMPFVWPSKDVGFLKTTFKNHCRGLGLPCFNSTTWVPVTVMVDWQYCLERVDVFIPPSWLAIEKKPDL